MDDGEDNGLYEGEHLRAVSFPLGGIGTGHFCVGGDGSFRQWQIFNQVNHIANLPGTFLALRTKRDGEDPVSRLLVCTDLHDDAEFTPAPSISDHLVPDEVRELAESLPTIGRMRMLGRYPVVEVEYFDDEVPLDVTLEALSPMIPLDAKNSGLPMAYLTFKMTNRTDSPVEASLMISLQNAVGWDGLSPISGVNNPLYGGNRNMLLENEGTTVLRMDNPTLGPDSPRNGQMSIATSSEGATAMPQWNDLRELWSFFDKRGTLTPDRRGPSMRGRTYNGALCRSLKIGPGEKTEVVFTLAWHFPNRYVNWDQRGLGVADQRSRFWLGNHYSKWFPGVLEVVRYAVENREELRSKTKLFRDSFFSSTIPWPILDAASSQMSVIRSPTCFREEDGKFFGFEGCRGASTGCSCDSGGCCPLNCTHVWNYEQSLSRLYPELERSMREIDLDFQMGKDGRVPHRTVLPLYLPRWHDDEKTSHVYAADGHCGTILKTYREYRISEDDGLLEAHWPNLKRALRYAIDTWDPDEDGVFDGPQWNTYDCHLQGKNSFVSGLYLASLRAMEELAKIKKEAKLAESCHSLFARGSASLDRELWNGEYYVQIYDEDAHRENQYGKGCHSDQLLGQWWANQLGLGKILPERHVRRALKSIYSYNFRRSMAGHTQKPRTYLKKEEGGLIMCTWPRGGRPDQVTLYSDEIWTGIEYAVAGTMLYEGMVEEALDIVKMARSRHDGRLRNPWNEVECGDHYARAMSSWVLLEAYSGFMWNASESKIGFSPVIDADRFRTFFIAGSAWGEYRHRHEDGRWKYAIEVNYGELRLNKIRLTYTGGKHVMPMINLGGEEVDGVKFSNAEGAVELELEVEIGEGRVLNIVLEED